MIDNFEVCRSALLSSIDRINKERYFPEIVAEELLKVYKRGIIDGYKMIFRGGMSKERAEHIVYTYVSKFTIHESAKIMCAMMGEEDVKIEIEDIYSQFIEIGERIAHIENSIYNDFYNFEDNDNCECEEQ